MTALLGAIGVAAGCGGNSETADGNAAGGGGTGGHAPATKCTPLSAVPLGGGFQACSEGFRHRPTAETCAPPTSVLRCDPAQSVDVSACATDSDCTARAHGYCGARGAYPGGLNDPCLCKYYCQSDADCSAGTICSCDEPNGGTCVPATCSTDAECSGTFCASARTGCLTPPQYHCFSATDGCSIDADCTPAEYCQFDEVSGKRSCATNGCGGIGRPFLVSGVERLAPHARRRDWLCDGMAPDVELDVDLRQALGRAWTRVALMEHASIAAFARFTLQLLSLGAPAELVERAQRAMTDETRHARLCFALASAYAGHEIGPDCLDVTDALLESTLERVVSTAIREGCAGETLAAAEAREGSLSASDPVIAAALHGIAEDEARHAALAFRFVAWAIEIATPTTRERIAVELERIAEACTAEAPEDDLRLSTHGFVVGEQRKALRARVISDVVVPCARSLAVRARGRYGTFAELT